MTTEIAAVNKIEVPQNYEIAKVVLWATETIKKQTELLAQRDIKIKDLEIKNEEQTKLIEAKNKKIAIQEKDLEFVHDITKDKETLMSIDETAKLLNGSTRHQIGQRKLISFLIHQRIFTKQSGYNVPYQRYINEGYFKVSARRIRGGKMSFTTKVTPKGTKYIHKLVARDYDKYMDMKSL